MPSDNLIKSYIKGAFYHIYNRGVAKQNIFLDESDYDYFLYKLEKYLTNTKKSERDHRENISLLSFCLMQNHFHLLVQNLRDRGIERFMRSLGTCFSMYFNRKYKRVGPVFQDRYKAKLVKSDEQLITTSLYIHKNPEEPPQEIINYPYSSAKYYICNSGASWINPSAVLNLLSKREEKSIQIYRELLGGS